jgi:cation transport regulator
MLLTMPYQSNKDLPTQVKGLPEAAKSMFRDAFNAAMVSSKDEEKAFRVAWSIVKKKFRKNDTKWVAKASSILPKIYHAKSSLTDGTSHFAEFIFADIRQDDDGDKIDKNVLCKKINGMEGDLEHANLFRRNEISGAPLFKVIDSFFDGERILGTVMFYEGHPQFSNVWQFCMDGDFGISLEYDGLEDIIGISGTVVPKNKRSKVLRAFSKGEEK